MIARKSEESVTNDGSERDEKRGYINTFRSKYTDWLNLFT